MIFIHVASQGIPGLAGFATELAVEARVVDVGGLHMPGDVRLEGRDLEAGEAGPLPDPAHHLHLHPLADQGVQVWQHKVDRGVQTGLLKCITLVIMNGINMVTQCISCFGVFATYVTANARELDVRRFHMS